MASRTCKIESSNFQNRLPENKTYITTIAFEMQATAAGIE